MKTKVYLAELIGTFALVMVGTGAGAQNAGLGGILAALYYQYQMNNS